MTVANYEDGDLEGRYIDYDEEGNALTTGQYEAGYEEGVWMFRNGTSYETGRYSGGLRDGVWKSWFEPGKLASEIQYADDMMDGKYVLYWENGNIRLTGKYENGLQEGIWQLYDEEGILSVTTLFQGGKELKWNNYTIK